MTISSCYGAGAEAYSGEGLVGLSWAFLRAGAHNVIGALWDVSDASTADLMGRIYDELKRGQTPESGPARGQSLAAPFRWDRTEAFLLGSFSTLYRAVK